MAIAFSHNTPEIYSFLREKSTGENCSAYTRNVRLCVIERGRERSALSSRLSRFFARAPRQFGN